jgi:hypothetical protein
MNDSGVLLPSGSDSLELFVNSWAVAYTSNNILEEITNETLNVHTSLVGHIGALRGLVASHYGSGR